MKQEIISEVAKAAPAVAGAALFGLTLNEWVAVATLLYIAIQGAYLLRKWWREERRGYRRSADTAPGSLE